MASPIGTASRAAMTKPSSVSMAVIPVYLKSSGMSAQPLTMISEGAGRMYLGIENSGIAASQNRNSPTQNSGVVQGAANQPWRGDADSMVGFMTGFLLITARRSRGIFPEYPPRKL